MPHPIPVDCTVASNEEVVGSIPAVTYLFLVWKKLLFFGWGAVLYPCRTRSKVAWLFVWPSIPGILGHLVYLVYLEKESLQKSCLTYNKELNPSHSELEVPSCWPPCRGLKTIFWTFRLPSSAVPSVAAWPRIRTSTSGWRTPTRWSSSRSFCDRPIQPKIRILPSFDQPSKNNKLLKFN